MLPADNSPSLRRRRGIERGFPPGQTPGAPTGGHPHPFRPPTRSPSADPHARPNPRDGEAQRYFPGPSVCPGSTGGGGFPPPGYGTRRRERVPGEHKVPTVQRVPRKSSTPLRSAGPLRARLRTLTRSIQSFRVDLTRVSTGVGPHRKLPRNRRENRRERVA